MRILRVYHAGRDASHQRRERMLAMAGLDVHLAVPSRWPGPSSVVSGSIEPFTMHELEVRRAGDVNRHHYADSRAIRRLVDHLAPDVVDIHEEPFSTVAHQILRVLPRRLPVAMYTAQNVDKRFPPPFWVYEKKSLARVQAFYPCSRQAASVVRGKGFGGDIEVVPLGVDIDTIVPGHQSADDDEIVLGLVGRMVPEKGVVDCVHVLAGVLRVRRARLILLGDGPELASALDVARTLGVSNFVEARPWQDAAALAEQYAVMHVVLIPSRRTHTWTEQFGRVIVEAKAAGAVVAGYDSGAIAEIGGAEAVLVNEGDVSGLTAAVANLVGDPIEFARRRGVGLDAIRHYTWLRVAEAQATIYARIASDGPVRTQRVWSVVDHRTQARREFGQTAPLLAGERPFALPWLRDHGLASTVAGRIVDLGGAGARRAAMRHPRQQ